MSDNPPVADRIIDEKCHCWIVHASTVTHDDPSYFRYADGGRLIEMSRSAMTRNGKTIRVLVPMSLDQETTLFAGLHRAGNNATDLAIQGLLWSSKSTQDFHAHIHPRCMTAGRPGSWESEVMTDTIHRAGQHPPPPPWTNGYAREIADVADVIMEWTTSPRTYVEVAENLVSVLGSVVNTLGGVTSQDPRYLTTLEGFDPCHHDPFSRRMSRWLWSRTKEANS